MWANMKEKPTDTKAAAPAETRELEQPEFNITAKGASAGSKLRSLPVDVTLEIIMTAVPANSGHCMISDAIKAAALKKGWRTSKVMTDLQTVRFTDLEKGIRYICFTPFVAQKALLDFDAGLEVKPFSFRLKPAQVLYKNASKRRQKARVAVRARNDGGTTKGAPVKHGGKAMPTLALGMRRGFGIRAMGVYAPKPEPAETTPELIT